MKNKNRRNYSLRRVMIVVVEYSADICIYFALPAKDSAVIAPVDSAEQNNLVTFPHDILVFYYVIYFTIYNKGKIRICILIF